MIKPSKNAHSLSDLLKKVDEKKPENEALVQINSSFCLKNKIAEFTQAISVMRAAFTLAEVLITLGIIGIVAAMTISSLIREYQRNETEVRLQKAYTTMSQAFLLAQAKHGEAKYWDWSDAEKILRDYFLPDIKGAVVFPTDESPTNLMCFEGKVSDTVDASGNPSSSQYGWIDKIFISSPFIPNKTASIKLMDGTCVGLNPTGAAEGSGKWVNYYDKEMFIDTNGSSRAPNIAGLDLFFFVIVDNNIRPYGYTWSYDELSVPNKSNSCHRKARAGGRVCATKIMSDGWTIKYW